VTLLFRRERKKEGEEGGAGNFHFPRKGKKRRTSSPFVKGERRSEKGEKGRKGGNFLSEGKKEKEFFSGGGDLICTRRFTRQEKRTSFCVTGREGSAISYAREPLYVSSQERKRNDRTITSIPREGIFLSPKKD